MPHLTLIPRHRHFVDFGIDSPTLFLNEDRGRINELDENADRWLTDVGEKVVTTERLTAQDLLRNKETEFAVADVTITFVILSSSSSASFAFLLYF